MPIALLLDWLVAQPAIGGTTLPGSIDSSTKGIKLAAEALRRRCIRIRPSPLPLFRGYCNQSFTLDWRPRTPSSWGAPVGLIHLDDARQTLHHRPPQRASKPMTLFFCPATLLGTKADALKDHRP